MQKLQSTNNGEAGTCMIGMASFGVFICQFAKCIVNGHTIGLVDQLLVSQSRRTMLSEITIKKLGEIKLIEE